MTETLFPDAPATHRPPKAGAKAPTAAKKVAAKKPAKAAAKPAPKVEPKKPGTAVAIHRPAEPRVPKVTGAMSMLAFIGTAARDPSVDPAKMRELLAIRKELKLEESKEQFTAALIAAQKQLPTITRRGKIEIEKNNRVIQSTPYAKFEDINRAVKPILQAHGFTMTFKTEAGADARTTVTAILRHKGGHEETSSLSLPVEASGSKNNVQGIGSSVSYGKRYTMTALLNLIAEGDDDDGNLGAGVAIDQEQLATLIEACEVAGVDKRRFCEFMGVAALAEIPATAFQRAMDAVRRKAGAK